MFPPTKLIVIVLFTSIAPMRVLGQVQDADSKTAQSLSALTTATVVENLRKITLAFHNFEATNQALPDSNGTLFPGDRVHCEGFSWRVQILPFVGQARLYNKFDFSKPWDDPHNLALATVTPDIYRVDGIDVPEGSTVVQALVGDGTVMSNSDAREKTRRISEVIKDNTSETGCCLTVPPENAVPWTKPVDLPLEQLSIGREDGYRWAGSGAHGLLVGMFDGTVRLFESNESCVANLDVAFVAANGSEFVLMGPNSMPRMDAKALWHRVRVENGSIAEILRRVRGLKANGISTDDLQESLTLLSKFRDLVNETNSGRKPTEAEFQQLIEFHQRLVPLIFSVTMSEESKLTSHQAIADRQPSIEAIDAYFESLLPEPIGDSVEVTRLRERINSGNADSGDRELLFRLRTYQLRNTILKAAQSSGHTNYIHIGYRKPSASLLQELSKVEDAELRHLDRVVFGPASLWSDIP